MITLLTLTAYASEPCVDAITDEPHEWLTWEATSTGIVIRQTDGPMRLGVPAHVQRPRVGRHDTGPYLLRRRWHRRGNG